MNYSTTIHNNLPQCVPKMEIGQFWESGIGSAFLWGDLNSTPLQTIQSKMLTQIRPPGWDGRELKNKLNLELVCVYVLFTLSMHNFQL